KRVCELPQLNGRSAGGSEVVAGGVGELVVVAELAAYFDGGQMRTQVIALADGASGLQIELRSQAVVDVEVVEREIILAGVSLREAGRGPLGKINVGGSRGIVLAVAGSEAGLKACALIADLPFLAGARNGEVPGDPRSRKV